MLTEIEDRLVKILQEKVVEIPEESIAINVTPNKSPAVVISNLGFKFENAGLAENIDEGKNELEESFSGDDVKVSYKLQEKPLKSSVRVESPLGTFLTEKGDYAINYKEGSIDFRKAPQAGKNNIFVKYLSLRRFMMLKSLKMKALYTIDVRSADRIEADSLAEKVVKALLTAEDELLAEGIQSKPIGGTVSVDEDKSRKIRLKYMFEKELRVETLVGPIEEIEITGKNL